jgi:hypothetical protein
MGGTGRADDDGDAEAGPVPEGAAIEPQLAEGSSARQGVPLLQVKGDIGPESLDMLAALNEPEQLMRALHRLANERTSRSWGVVARYAGIAEEALKAANEPPVNRPTV